MVDSCNFFNFEVSRITRYGYLCLGMSGVS